jgi:hypothetical protein
MSRINQATVAALAAFAILALAACNTGGVGTATGTPGSSPAASPAGTASPPASAEPSAAASPSGSGLNQAFLQFEEQGGSGITGGAILTDLGDGTTAVTIGVVAAGITEPMPANIVSGTCDSPGGAAASPAASAGASPSAAASLEPGSTVKLGDLTAGASNTVVEMTLDELTSTPNAIVIYTSAADDTIVACANVEK